jgi:hypothetical protein
MMYDALHDLLLLAVTWRWTTDIPETRPVIYRLTKKGIQGMFFEKKVIFRAITKFVNVGGNSSSSSSSSNKRIMLEPVPFSNCSKHDQLFWKKQRLKRRPPAATASAAASLEQQQKIRRLL